MNKNGQCSYSCLVCGLLFQSTSYIKSSSQQRFGQINDVNQITSSLQHKAI